MLYAGIVAKLTSEQYAALRAGEEVAVTVPTKENVEPGGEIIFEHGYNDGPVPVVHAGERMDGVQVLVIKLHREAHPVRTRFTNPSLWAQNES